MPYLNKVLYNITQSKSEEEKATARSNIDAASVESVSEESERAIAAEVASASYDSENHLIIFKNSANTQLFSLDAAAFVKDGMVDNVVVENDKLKITFNTDSGKQAIEIPISDIFDSSLYYTKIETDTKLNAKVDKTSIATSGTLGLVKSTTTGTTSGRDYSVEVKNDGTMKVNVPWTDTNTWPTIQNNLSSDATGDALSAAMGKALANGDAQDRTKLPLAGGTMTGDIEFTTTSATEARQIIFKVASNDYARIMAQGTGVNTGFMEIATADDGNEPIYVRQYSSVYSTITRTLTLLDGSGNTTLPGNLNVGGNGSITGTLNVSDHTYLAGTLGVASNTVVRGSFTVGNEDTTVSDYQKPTTLYGTLNVRHKATGSGTSSATFTLNADDGGIGMTADSFNGKFSNFTAEGRCVLGRVGTSTGAVITLKGDTECTGYLNAPYHYGTLVASNRKTISAAYNINAPESSGGYTPKYIGELIYIANIASADVSVTYKDYSGVEKTNILSVGQMCILMCVGIDSATALLPTNAKWAYK